MASLGGGGGGAGRPGLPAMNAVCGLGGHSTLPLPSEIFVLKATPKGQR